AIALLHGGDQLGGGRVTRRLRLPEVVEVRIGEADVDRARLDPLETGALEKRPQRVEARGVRARDAGHLEAEAPHCPAQRAARRELLGEIPDVAGDLAT